MPAPYRILIATDFSEPATLAFGEAISVAHRTEYPELHVVAVIDKEASELVPAEDRHASLTQIVDHMRDRLIAEAGRFLEARKGPPLRAIAHVRMGRIADEIANLATEIRADLVVVGTHGRRGMKRLVLGSVAEHTVRLAPCPVLVVRAKNFHAMDTVPEIEPTCPQCLKIREQTEGATWWCEGHISTPDAPHIYSRTERLDQPPSVSAFRS